MLFSKKLKNDYGVNIDEKNVNKLVDFTLLNPTATHKELEKFMCCAYKNKYYSVCVNPINVDFCKKYIEYRFKGNLKVVAVISFPLGANALDTKVFEVKKAIKDGADEVDVVINLASIKDGDWTSIKYELGRVRKVSRKKILKVVIETALFTKTEIEKISLICAKYKVDYIMTSTGFADGGATPEIVEIIRNTIKNKCGIKASGGVETRAQAINLIRIGATRIGTSREI